MFVPSRRPAARADAGFGHIPAPAGLNTITPAGIMPIRDCNVLWNLVGGEEGARVRLGYREWVTSVENAAGVDGEVRTILPFMASQSSNNKLFAVTNKGIYDCTPSSDAPTLLVTFGTQTNNAGYGQYHVFVVSGSPNTHYLIYCDEENGMYTWSESGAAWTKTAAGAGAAEINGVDPANIVGVCSFKQRLWYIEKNSTNAWYTNSAGALFGNVTKFNFGQKFKQGGGLRNLYNLTYDGGAGMDDSLVAISDAGDIAIYQGIDPTDMTTFELKGVWSLGAIPAGRNIATDFGGDLLLLSKAGIFPASRLVVGVAGLDEGQYATYKIGPQFNQLALRTGDLQGWSLRIHPEEHALIVTVPTSSGQATNQLVMSISTKGWGRYRDLPILSTAVYNGKFYFGTADGRVCINDGYQDNRRRDDPNTYSDIRWSFVTSFQNFGNGLQKQVGNIRTNIRTQGGEPEYNVEANYRFDLSEADNPGPASVAGGSTWGSGLWGTAVWGGGYVTSQEVRGAVGMGPEFAIAAKGNSRSRTVIIGFDVSYRQGGFL